MLGILDNVLHEIVQTEIGENKVGKCFDASYAVYSK